MGQKITPFLWFDTQAEEAMNFYGSIFPGFEILEISRYGEGGPGPAGSVLVANFKIAGLAFSALNGGPMYKFSPATSFQIDCSTQEEVDHYWHKLSEGGATSQCGWLDDKFGVTWQVVPKQLGELLSNPDPEIAGRVMQAMLQMTKLDIAVLEAAAAGE